VFFKQRAACDLETWLEFRRVLFRSRILFGLPRRRPRGFGRGRQVIGGTEFEDIEGIGSSHRRRNRNPAEVDLGRTHPHGLARGRSEERRVGKARRTRWTTAPDTGRR